jgi:hypothetical protein
MGTVYFGGSTHLLHVRLCINTSEDYKSYIGKAGIHGSNVEIIALSEIYKTCQCLFCA